MWRETPRFFRRFIVDKFQSTPSVWRETNYEGSSVRTIQISIHSLRVEGDVYLYSDFSVTERISIHSLRVEGDNVVYENPCSKDDFNPLPPCGGRLSRNKRRLLEKLFQSTPSVWRETIEIFFKEITENISIHSLRVEGDLYFQPGFSCRIIFQSTPSVWRETSRMTG